MVFNPNSLPLYVPFDSNGYSVTIWRDAHAVNPWDVEVYKTPVAWVRATSRDIIRTRDYGDNILNFFETVTPKWVKKNASQIESIFGFRSDIFEMDVMNYALLHGMSKKQARRIIFTETLATLATARGWRGVWNFFLTLDALYTLAGVKTRIENRTGYIQDDSTLFLLVATPHHLERCGRDSNVVASDLDLKKDADTLTAWLWGDVYGFNVANHNKSEPEKSYGLFYGSYSTEDSGLLDAIRDVTSASTLQK
jgi:hypothetical protein